MSILADGTDHKAIRVIVRALHILEQMPSDIRMTKNDDFEMTLAINMLKSIIDNNPKVIEIKQPEA